MPVLSKEQYEKALKLAKEEGYKIGYAEEKPQAYEPAPPPKRLLKRAQKAVQLNSMIVEAQELSDQLYIKAKVLQKFPEAVVLFEEDKY